MRSEAVEMIREVQWLLLEKRAKSLLSLAELKAPEAVLAMAVALVLKSAFILAPGATGDSVGRLISDQALRDVGVCPYCKAELFDEVFSMCETCWKDAMKLDQETDDVND